jgi:hypothetical protein
MMPEYLSPGVYVEEIDAGVKPIPGVSTSLEGSVLEDLAVEFRRAMRTSVPAWTEINESDPGVTLLEVLAFLSESLLYRTKPVPERGRAAASRAIAALSGLGLACEPGSGSLRRPSFFSGQLLDAATLAAEQDYHREKLRRHNRAVLGCGVVTGLGVSVEGDDSGGSRVVVEPGCAIDPRGEEVSLASAVSLAIRAQGDSAFVTVRYWERVCGAVVEEACVIGILPDVVAPALGLARLVRADGRWEVDPAFAPPRARHD